MDNLSKIYLVVGVTDGCCCGGPDRNPVQAFTDAVKAEAFRLQCEKGLDVLRKAATDNERQREAWAKSFEKIKSKVKTPNWEEIYQKWEAEHPNPGYVGFPKEAYEVQEVDFVS